MSFRVLVVEDDRQWRLALRKMYTEILEGMNPAVTTASNGPEAIELLESEQFELLSLDINLLSTHPGIAEGKPNRRIPGANGLDVVRIASETKACQAVVVITGMQHDEKLKDLIPIEDQRVESRMSLDVHLYDYFGERKLILNKIPNLTIQANISKLKKALTSKKLIKLCGQANLDNEFRYEGEHWLIKFEGESKRYKDTKGLHYIAYLIHEEREIFCLELERWYEKSSTSSGFNLKDVYQWFTEEERREMRERITEYQHELDQLKSVGQGESKEAKAYEEEIKRIRRYLRKGYDPESDAAKNVERSRKTVSRTLRFALNKIKKHQPKLWTHLCQKPESLRIGTFLSYQPNTRPVWSINLEGDR